MRETNWKGDYLERKKNKIDSEQRMRKEAWRWRSRQLSCPRPAPAPDTCRSWGAGLVVCSL